jgi:NAD(P)-dependent dehydrogenase (short-subunit alcohol dehydrogenase family)
LIQFEEVAMNRLEGRRAVITGAGSGIGRASALRFAQEGAAVLVVGRSSGNTEETAALVRAAGGRAEAMVVDATVEANVEAMVARCVAAFGGLEVFFANAATPGTNTPLLEQSVDEWNEVWRVNTLSCFLAVKHAGRHMTAQGSGSIILTSSAASLRANAGAISYSASKAAVNSLVQTSANAFSGTGVRVNAILPGLVETQMTRKVFEQARERGVEARIGHMTPMKRAGRPEEIAAMAAFLASDDSSFVTGQWYAVDGGVSSTHPHGRIAL